ncbi:hypothetical protein CAEBREN_19637 [Caenorhabditis brenneri]|uniref:Cytochrome P450 n=1 Tax=Caenorhabditis brenneri TaxID=135651 RepID=G0MAM8_CAEBE|nr:hypothetical protein CAEBREN_19637 [Caenorhabditis brenneri]
MLILLALLGTLLAILAGYALRASLYWKWRNVPGPTGWPLLGSFYEVANVHQPRCFILNKWTKIFGKVYGYYEGVRPVLVISDIAMVRELFIEKFNSFYGRKLTNMLHGDMEKTEEEPVVEGIVEESASQMLEILGDAVHTNGVNIHSFYQEYTFDVISRLCMGQDETLLFRNPNVEVVKSVLLRSHRVLPWYLAVAFPRFQFQVKKLFMNHENVRGGQIGRLFMICRKLVVDRQAEQNGEDAPGNDFVDFLLKHATEEIADRQLHDAFERKATPEDIVGACFVFLLAGFDTTANSLACASFLLAKHPKKMRKAQEEIGRVIGLRAVTYDSTRQMPYLEAIVKETLRLYPVGYFAVSRECTKDTTLGGIPIEQGVQVEVDVIGIHKDKEIWGKNADDFVPERWLDDTTRDRMSFLAFGAGKRECVGRKLGMSEAITGLVHVLRKYNLKTGPNTEDELQLHGCTTTSPEAVTLYLERRN